MHAKTIALLTAALLLGCSSSDDTADPNATCTLSGTFVGTAVRESGTCSDVYGTPTTAQVTYTVSPAPSVASNAVLISDGTVSCTMLAKSCKVDDVCQLSAKGGGTISVQFSLRFDKTTMSGIVVEHLPPIPMIGADPARAACDQTDNVSTTLR